MLHISYLPFLQFLVLKSQVSHIIWVQTVPPNNPRQSVHLIPKALDLSQNPLGPVGIRSLVRLLVREELGNLDFWVDGVVFYAVFRQKRW